MKGPAQFLQMPLLHRADSIMRDVLKASAILAPVRMHMAEVNVVELDTSMRSHVTLL